MDHCCGLMKALHVTHFFEWTALLNIPHRLNIPQDNIVLNLVSYISLTSLSLCYRQCRQMSRLNQ